MKELSQSAESAQINGHLEVRANFYDHVKDTAGAAWRGSLGELTEKVRGLLATERPCARDPDGKLNRKAKACFPCWGAYELKGTRAAANVAATHAEQLDFDELTGEQFEMLRQLPFAGFGYTSPSDPLPSGVRCAKVFVFYDRPVTAEERPRARAALCKLLRETLEIEIDQSTHNADRVAFIGHAAGEPEREFWTLQGEPFAVASALALATEQPPAKPAEPATAPKPSAAATGDFEPDVQAVAALLRPHFAEGKRNEIRLRGAGALRHAGWPQDAAERLFVDALAPDDGDDNKARAAVANSYNAAESSGWSRFADLVPDRSAAEAIRGIVYRRRDELDRAFAEKLDAEHATPVDSAAAAAPEPAEDDEVYFDVFAALPPVPWVVQSLDLAPGAPTIAAGFGFSGKTVSLQAMALSIVSGRAIWGAFQGPREPGVVLHLDYEQGSRLTSERYQRLARDMGLNPDEVRKRLRVKIAPKTLDRPGAEDWLVKRTKGCALVIIDSFRAAWPTLDENASDSRSALDTLFRVSEKTGATFIVVHHAGKSADGKAKRERLRGSSALFDACQSVLLFEPTRDERGAPIRVTQTKARLSGRPATPFELVISDVARGIEPNWGLSVKVENAPARDEVAELESAILDALRKEPGCTQSRLQLRIKRRKADVGDALRDLAERGMAYRQEGVSDDGKKTRGWYANPLSRVVPIVDPGPGGSASPL